MCGRIYEYTCLPNGLASAPRIFIKLMGVVFSYLRSNTLTSVVYLDDVLLIGRDLDSCSKNLNLTLGTLQSLGFYINYEKSDLIPSKRVIFLRFEFRTDVMKLFLTEDRKRDLVSSVDKVMENQCLTIRQLASVLGKIIAALPVFSVWKALL